LEQVWVWFWERVNDFLERPLLPGTNAMFVPFGDFVPEFLHDLLKILLDRKKCWKKCPNNRGMSWKRMQFVGRSGCCEVL